MIRVFIVFLFGLVACGGRTGPQSTAEDSDASTGNDAGVQLVDGAAPVLCGAVDIDASCVISPLYHCQCGGSCYEAGALFASLPLCDF